MVSQNLLERGLAMFLHLFSAEKENQEVGSRTAHVRPHFYSWSHMQDAQCASGSPCFWN